MNVRERRTPVRIIIDICPLASGLTRLFGKTLRRAQTVVESIHQE